MTDEYAEKMVDDHPPPLGDFVHLHFLMRGWGWGNPMWVLRGRKSRLCGTKRCRIVSCKESYVREVERKMRDEERVQHPD